MNLPPNFLHPNKALMLSLQFCLTPIFLSFKPRPKPKILSNLPQQPTPHVHRPPPLLATNIINEQPARATTVAVNKTGASAKEYQPLPAGLRRELMPNHVAVVMDGNRRWARMKGLPIGSGYEAGVRALRGLVELCIHWGIRVLTVFAFSSENWSRPKIEVELLMGLFQRALKDELDRFMREDIRISFIGNRSKLPKPLNEMITDAENITVNNSRLHLVVAVNYSGQYDVVQACQKISQKVKDGLLDPAEINESLVEQELETSCIDFPYPDLLIRTSGELRISNFLLWQLAYTELFFAESHWPEFGESEFIQALSSYQQRQRRYGGRNS